MVATVRVALPNLDPCSGNRPSIQVENAPGDPRDTAPCRPLVSGHMHQIILGIVRKALRVERAGVCRGVGGSVLAALAGNRSSDDALRTREGRISACTD